MDNVDRHGQKWMHAIQSDRIYYIVSVYVYVFKLQNKIRCKTRNKCEKKHNKFHMIELIIIIGLE